MKSSDPYEVVDPVLMAWAKRRGITISTTSRDDVVRTFWTYSWLGAQRAQLWLGVPDENGSVTVFAAALDPSSPTKWGPREQRRATLASLEDVLDELFALVVKWAGPGGHA